MSRNAQGAATKTRTSFSLVYAVSTPITATHERIWGILTDATHFTQWNSTLTSLEGDIAPGGAVKMTVPEAPGRVFKVKVSEFVPNRRLVWRDGFALTFQGVRTYTLHPNEDGTTQYTMTEALSGLFLPMIANQLPNFAPIFERYAADLKRVAEKN